MAYHLEIIETRTYKIFYNDIFGARFLNSHGEHPNHRLNAVVKEKLSL